MSTTVYIGVPYMSKSIFIKELKIGEISLLFFYFILFYIFLNNRAKPIALKRNRTTKRPNKKLVTKENKSKMDKNRKKNAKKNKMQDGGPMSLQIF